MSEMENSPAQNVPGSGERCNICGDPATHKVSGQEIVDDLCPEMQETISYVCKPCFIMITGQ
jgi:hypothetical protein